MTQSTAFTELLDRTSPRIGNTLRYLDSLAYEEAQSCLQSAKQEIFHARSSFGDSDPDELLNRVFVLEQYVGALSDYVSFWDKLSNSKFRESWDSLQDLQDGIRTVYRFIQRPRPRLLQHIEKQCGDLETLYPYSLFCSIGVIVEGVECSICGRSIESFECEHIKGELYRGRIAYGIVKEVKQLDHVALVTNPQDKRCVVIYEDSSPQFRLVAFLRDLITSVRMSPLGFSHLEWKKIRVSQGQLAKIGRNDLCTCGSGKKYKRCCVNKDTVERDHVDIIGSKIDVDSLVGDPLLEPRVTSGSLAAI